MPDSNTSNRKWKRSQRVLALWTTDGYWYSATIMKIKNKKIQIAWDSNDPDIWVTDRQLMALEYTKGDKVEAFWDDDGSFYPATVKEAHGEQVLVVYDNGTEEWTFPGKIRFKIDGDNIDIDTGENENYLQGNKYFEAGNYSEAIEFYNKTIEEEPEHFLAWNDIGACYAWQDRWDESLSFFEKAVVLNPESDTVYINLINAYFTLNSIEQVIDIYNKAVKNGVQIDNGETYRHLGDCYYVKNDFKTAIEFFEQAFEYDDKDYQALTWIGWSYIDLGEPQKGIDYCQKAVEINPENEFAHLGIGNGYFDMGNYAKAIPHYKNAIKVNKEYAVAYNNLGKAHHNKFLNKNTKTDYKKAITNFKRAIKLSPDYALFYSNLLLAFVGAKDFDNAIKFAEKCESRKIKIDNAEIYNRIANYFVDIDRLDDALKYYNLALEIEPDNPVYRENYEIAEKRNKESNELNAEDNKTEGLGYEIPEKVPVKQTLDEINALIGLDNIKEDITSLVHHIEVEKLREEQGLSTSQLTLHSVFSGSPGTGKTTIARILGKVYKSLGLIEKGHVVEVDRSGLVAEYIGQTAAKTNEVINQAADGILFIDEAYSLIPADSSNDFGKEAVETLLKRMEDNRSQFIVVVAGYTDEMNSFIKSNPGLSSRFARRFVFKDYTPEELFAIFNHFCKEKDYVLEKAAESRLMQYFNHIYSIKDKYFGNGREVRNKFQEITKVQSGRVYHEVDSVEKEKLKQFLSTITLRDVEAALKSELQMMKSETVEQAMQRINQLIGLENIKKEIDTLTKYIKVSRLREKQGIVPAPLTLHSVFCGSPGTGKTTVARMLGRVFKALGILKSGHVVEADRSKLVAEFVGQTAPKTNALIDSAMHGILFIDEAYTLNSGQDSNDFGKEAIDTIVKRMEDDRGKFIVIVAGYPQPMNEFINANPGFRSRFIRYFNFSDYNPDELLAIFKLLAHREGYKIETQAEKRLYAYITTISQKKTSYFGNGREMRNLLEKIKQVQSVRVAELENPTADILNTITLTDTEEVLKDEKDDIPPQKKIGF